MINYSSMTSNRELIFAIPKRFYNHQSPPQSVHIDHVDSFVVVVVVFPPSAPSLVFKQHVFSIC